MAIPLLLMSTQNYTSTLAGRGALAAGYGRSRERHPDQWTVREAFKAIAIGVGVGAVALITAVAIAYQVAR